MLSFVRSGHMPTLIHAAIVCVVLLPICRAQDGFKQMLHLLRALGPLNWSTRAWNFFVLLLLSFDNWTYGRFPG